MSEPSSDFRRELEARGVSRREFMGFCSAMAVLFGLPKGATAMIADAVENSPKPTLVWLNFQDCAGNTESFLRASKPTAAEVILDLIYEARDIDQELGSQEKIDEWFSAKTKGLNDWQKDELKRKWSTLQKVLSSRSRMDRVVSDIIFDFNVKPRLSSERGNARRLGNF